MPTEAEKRLHRCCFSGHRPEKLEEPEAQIKDWLREQIESAIAAGFTTFISGCAMGVDIWAGQIVIRLRDEEKVRKGSSVLRLIAATPWPGFTNRWNIDWQEQYSQLLRDADLVVPVSNRYSNDVFDKRNEWMVDHSNRLIAFYNGAPGGTRNIIEYAQKHGVEVVSNNPEYVEKIRKPKQPKQPKEEAPLTVDYPENLITAIGLERIFEEKRYTPLTEDQLAGLEHVTDQLPEKERVMVELRFRQKQTFQACGEHFGFTRQRAEQVCSKAVKKLRLPEKIMFIRDGFDKSELTLMITAAEEIKIQLRRQKKRYPLMNEEDVVKFVFQAMLGVEHLITDPGKAEERLKSEMEGLEADEKEPLIEKLSPQWCRMNLRAAKREGISEADVAYMLCESAKTKGLSFTRRNVYNFCVKMDGSETMKAAAEKVLDENWLPAHSDAYRAAYHPAYRVLYKDYRKFTVSYIAHCDK